MESFCHLGMGDGSWGEAMKLAFLNDVAYEYAIGGRDAIGGLERNIWFHSRALAAAGWSVQIGVRGGLKANDRRIIEGVEYVGIGQGRILMDWYRFLSAEQPNWLYWGGASILWGPLVEIAKLAGVRTVFAAALDADVVPRRAVFRRSNWWPLFAWGIWRADRIFVQHGGQMSLLSPSLRVKASILPKVCIVPTAIRPHARREAYVAWVGTLRRHKRPDILIEIARRVPEIRFIVCGAPMDYLTDLSYGTQMMETLARLPNVDYRGRVPPEEADQVIADAAVLLCTSDEEGFPNTFTQAWSSGTPIVTLTVDPDNLIKKKMLGVVSGSVNDAAKDIRTLMASSNQREEIGVRARQHISENHNPAVIVGVFAHALGGGLQSSQH